MEQPARIPFENLDHHLQAVLQTRLGRAIVGNAIADQLLETVPAPLPDNNSDEIIITNGMNDAAIRNLLFLSIYPGKARANIAAPPIEPDTPMFTDEELNDNAALLPYPQLPYYKEVIKVLRLWIARSEFPLTFIDLAGLHETCSEQQRMSLQTPDVLRIASAWIQASDTDRADICIDLLKLLGVRGILTMLRVRRTMGTTLAQLPPPMQRLVWAFNSTGKGRASLTEGARAVSKHFHRDSTNRYWGENKGSDAQKNQHANEILRRIFRATVWINLHQLPHDITTCEIRTADGYGARWTGDGAAFRGFLEPHCEDGHEKGWKH